MRKLLYLVLALTFAVPAFSQQFAAPAAAPPDGPGWSRVQALPNGAHIHVHGRSHSSACRFAAISDESLTCAAVDGAPPLVYAKADIRKITMSHRGRSSLIGAGIGAGIGLIVGAASATSNDSIITRGQLAAILAVPGAILGAIVGAFSDFTGSTIYKA